MRGTFASRASITKRGKQGVFSVGFTKCNVPLFRSLRPQCKFSGSASVHHTFPWNIGWKNECWGDQSLFMTGRTGGNNILLEFFHGPLITQTKNFVAHSASRDNFSTSTLEEYHDFDAHSCLLNFFSIPLPCPSKNLRSPPPPLFPPPPHLQHRIRKQKVLTFLLVGTRFLQTGCIERFPFLYPVFVEPFYSGEWMFRKKCQYWYPGRGTPPGKHTPNGHSRTDRLLCISY